MSVKAAAEDNGYNALVVEGGAMRGIFATGVFDAFLKEGFNPFDIYIGVSAGATNIAPYLAGMYRRNYKVYTDYSIRPDFISWRKFLTGGHLIDLDWLWDITIKEVRLDLEKIFSTMGEYYVGVTDVATGGAVYLKPDKDSLEDILKASSSIPVLYRKFIKINGVDYADGGLADPIPVMEAYRRNAKNIMVIRSRPYSYTMKSSSNKLLNRLYLRRYPELLNTVINRPKAYERSIEFMRNPPDGINIFEVNPPEDFKTQRLTRDISVLKQDYNYGYETGAEIIKKWNSKK